MGSMRTGAKQRHNDSYLERKFRHPDQMRPRPEDGQDDSKK